MNLLILGTLLSLAPGAGPGFQAKHGIDETMYQAWVNRLGPQTRVAFVNVHVFNGKPLFSAIAVHDARLWSARHAMTAAAYQQEYDKQVRNGFRPTSVCGYTLGNTPYYAATFVQETQVHWSARHGIPSARYQAEFDAAKQRNEMPSFIAGYRTAGGHELAAVFLPGTGQAFEDRHGLTSADYQKLYDSIGKNGFWPYVISAYNTEAGVRFAAVFVKDPSVESFARHGMTAAEYQQAFDRQIQRGFRPWNISGYVDGNASRYAAVWVRDALPVTGAAVPKLRAFDDAMLTILHSRGWYAGAIAVSHNGKTVLARGYGYCDPNHRIPVSPNTPFRIASLTKPITASVVRRMVADKLFKLDDKAFDLLGVSPTASGDKRLKDITVEQLLNHRGGWDKDNPPKYDPMFDSLKIAAALGQPAPAKPKDIVDYMLGQPLQHKPGDEYHYSNFGYCVLGRIIEKKSGRSYIDELKRRVCRPLGMSTLAVGHTSVGLRNPTEPMYFSDQRVAVNVFDPKGNKIAWPDGGFHLEAMDSHGGLIASAPDMVKFARAYLADGTPRAGMATSGPHTGALAGTFTFMAWRNKDVQLVVLFNQRSSDSDHKAIMNEIYRVADGVTNWP
jgi:CubicO group peptidase (beta-lactamase class C family)